MEEVLCKVCGSKDTEVFYHGPIRLGTFGQHSPVLFKVYKCKHCKSKFLPAVIDDLSEYYQSSEYRNDVNRDNSIETYHNLHDREQTRNLKITGIELYRNKVVADIGCGGGSFLDAIKGVSKYQLAIEPSEEYRKHLQERGYRIFPYTENALPDYRENVDVAVSFSVIEHIQEPIQFLENIHSLLHKTGTLIISTPNANDALLEMLPEDYTRFFYRKVHLWYFDQESLKTTLEMAGFKNIRIIPHQRFGIGNFLGWIKDRKPQGAIHYNFISEAININWKHSLENNFRCDYLFAIAEKG